MQSVKFVPAHGSIEPVSCAGVELTPGIEATVSDETAAVLFTNRNFVDAKTGKNPNFVCKDCGRETHQDGVFDPILARTHGSPVRLLIDADGRRRCEGCMNKASVPVAYVPDIKVQDED